MYLCKKLTDLSFPEIGRLFNDKHHSTVMYSVEKIDEMRAAPTPTSTARSQGFEDHFCLSASRASHSVAVGSPAA